MEKDRRPEDIEATEFIYSISEVSKQLNTPQSTLRGWAHEMKEFLDIGRDRYNNRMFTAPDIEILRMVRELRNEGLNNEQIRRRLAAILEEAARARTAAAESSELELRPLGPVPDRMPEELLQALTMRVRESIREELLQELREEIREEVRTELQGIGDKFGAQIGESSEALRQEIGSSNEQLRKELGEKLEEISGVLSRMETHGKRKSLLSRLFGGA